MSALIDAAIMGMAGLAIMGCMAVLAMPLLLIAAGI